MEWNVQHANREQRHRQSQRQNDDRPAVIRNEAMQPLQNEEQRLRNNAGPTEIAPVLRATASACSSSRQILRPHEDPHVQRTRVVVPDSHFRFGLGAASVDSVVLLRPVPER